MLLAFLSSCLNLARAFFIQASFFCVLASFILASLSFCFTIWNIFSPVMRYSVKTFFLPGPLSCTGNGAKSAKVQTLPPGYKNTLFRSNLLTYKKNSKNRIYKPHSLQVRHQIYFEKSHDLVILTFPCRISSAITLFFMCLDVSPAGFTSTVLFSFGFVSVAFVSVAFLAGGEAAFGFLAGGDPAFGFGSAVFAFFAGGISVEVDSGPLFTIIAVSLSYLRDRFGICGSA